jgi:hypothetical protein
MRILYDNTLLDALSIAPSSQDSNFNVGNMLTPSLGIAYRSADISSPHVTIIFSEAKSFNCIALAGHNLTSIRVRLYADSEDTIGEELADETFTNPLSTDIMYMDTVEGVKKVLLSMVTSETYVEIGYMSMGLYFQMPRPNAFYDESMEITNNFEHTQFGQVYGTDGVLLQTYSPEFVNVTQIQMATVKAMINMVRNYKPVFVDMTEDAHDYKEPLYAVLDMMSASMSRYTRGVQRGTFALKIREAR